MHNKVSPYSGSVGRDKDITTSRGADYGNITAAVENEDGNTATQPTVQFSVTQNTKSRRIFFHAICYTHVFTLV